MRKIKHLFILIALLLGSLGTFHVEAQQLRAGTDIVLTVTRFEVTDLCVGSSSATFTVEGTYSSGPYNSASAFINGTGVGYSGSFSIKWLSGPVNFNSGTVGTVFQENMPAGTPFLATGSTNTLYQSSGTALPSGIYEVELTGDLLSLDRTANLLGQTTSFEVKPTPTVSVFPSSLVVCSGEEMAFDITATEGSEISWAWDTATDNIGLANGTHQLGTGETMYTLSHSYVNTGTAAVTSIDTIRAQLDGCYNAIPNPLISMTVNPEVNIRANGQDNAPEGSPIQIAVCSDVSFTVTDTSNITGNTFYWEFVSGDAIAGISDDSQSVSGNINAFTFTPTNTTNAALTALYRVYAVANDCYSDTLFVEVTANPFPVISVINGALDDNITVCPDAPYAGRTYGSNVAGTAFTYALIPSGTPNVDQLTWDVSIPDSAKVNSFTQSNNGATTLTDTYEVYADFEGCIDTTTFTVNVPPTITITADLPTQDVCNGAASLPVTFTSNLGGNEADSIRWEVTSAYTAGLTTLSGVVVGNVLPAFPVLVNNSEDADSILTVRIIPIEGGCEGTPYEIEFVVKPTPRIPSIASLALCDGETAPAIALPTTQGLATITYNLQAGSLDYNLASPIITVPTGLITEIPSITADMASVATNPGDTVRQSFTLVATISLNTCVTTQTDAFAITIYPVSKPDVVFNLSTLDSIHGSPWGLRPDSIYPANMKIVDFESASNFVIGYEWEKIGGEFIGLDLQGSGLKTDPNGGDIMGGWRTLKNLNPEPVFGHYIVRPILTGNVVCKANTEFDIYVAPWATDIELVRVDDIADIEICSNVESPAFAFAGNLAPKGTYRWELLNDSINPAGTSTEGLPLIGTSLTFPSFKYVNATGADVKVSYKVTPQYGEGILSEDSAKVFNVTIHPEPVLPLITDVRYENDSIVEIILDDQMHYASQQLSGDNVGILGMTDNVFGGTAVNTGATVLAAVYQITPLDSIYGCPGAPQTFTVRVNPAIIEPAADPLSFAYFVGDNADAHTFTGSKANTTYAWGYEGSVPAGLASPVGADSGNNILPAFKALTAGVYTFFVVPTMDRDISVGGPIPGDTVRFTITILARPVVGLQIPDSVYCHNTMIAPILTTDSCRFELVAGVELGLTYDPVTKTVSSSLLSNTTNAPVSGTYRLTPIALDKVTEGEAVEFTVTVKPEPKVNVVGNLVYLNGDAVPAINFTGVATSYNWTATGNVGNQLSGNDFIPSFTAINLGETDSIAVISVTPSYDGCVGTASDVVTIKVLPNTIDDLDLVMREIADITVCSGTTIPAITPIAFNRITDDNYADGVVTFESKLVSGVDVLSGTTNTTTGVVSGTYLVIPFMNNNQGVPTTYTISVKPQPTVNLIGELVYLNGDVVPAIDLTGVATSFAWTATNANAIGLNVTGGSNTIPSFTAYNGGDADLSAVFSVIPSYDGCPGVASNAVTIKVLPNTVGDFDLVMTEIADITVCSDETFPTIEPVAFDRISGDPYASGVAYETKLVSGVDVLAGSSYANTTTGIVSGTYIVIPFMNNNQGVPTMYTVNVKPQPTVNLIGELVYLNGDVVPAIDLTGVATSFAWTAANATDIGLNVTSGSNTIPSFTAYNGGDADLSAVFSVIPSYDGCEGTATPVVTIKVLANTIKDLDLVMTEIADITVCSDETFPTIEPVAFDRISGDPYASGVAYETKLVSGVDVLAGSSYTNTTTGIVSGTYIVIPFMNNNQGVPTLYTVSVKPQPSVDKITPIYVFNGEVVSAISFTGVATSFEWEASGDNVNNAQGTGKNIIPAFVASNTTGAPLAAQYKVTPSYDGCPGTAVEEVVVINVLPNTVEDIDLIATSIEDQTVCSAGAIAAIEFNSVYRFANQGFDESLVTYELKKVGGVDVLSTATITNDGATGAVIANTTNELIYGTYLVTPVWNNKQGVPVLFTIHVLPVTNVHQVADQTICNNSGTTAVAFGGDVLATIYEWSTVINGSLTGFPSSGFGDIPSHVLTNSGSVPATVAVTVTPRYAVNGAAGKCTGAAMSFVITVNPTPVVDQVADIIYSFDKGQSDPIAFNSTVAGVTYKWKNDNPDTGLASEGTGNIQPFTVKNTSAAPIVSTVTVTPWFGDCEGKPMTFTITVNAKPGMGAIPHQEYCEGDVTNALDANLGYGTGSYITWTVSGDYVGLKNSDQYVGKLKTIPSYTAEYNLPRSSASDLAKAIVTVTPYYDNSGVISAGDPYSFEITVIPNTILDAGYAQTDAKIEVCPSNQEIRLEVKATGYQLKYQWYRNGEVIPGAEDAIYTIVEEEATNYHAGEYYATVISAYKNSCGAVALRSVTYNVKLNVVGQRWNDVMVLNCNPETNGGFVFTDYQWYTMPVSGGSEFKLSGENLSYLQVPGGVSNQVLYFVKAVTSTGNVYTSCPVAGIVGGESVLVSIYPNPVSVGQQVTVESLGVTLSKIQLISDAGRVLSAQNATGVKTLVTMPNTPGIYIIRTVISGTDETREFKVIVK